MEFTCNNFINEKCKTRLVKWVVCVLLFFLLMGINNAFVYYTSLTPFGIGLVFALLYIKFNGYILAMLYTLSNLPFSFSVSNIISSFVVGIVLCLSEYMSQSKKISYKKFHVCILSIVAMMGYIAVGISGDVSKCLALFVSIVLGLFFLLSCIYFFDAVFNKCMLGRLNLDEKICGCVILILFGIGICNANIYIFSLGLIFTSIIIQVITKVFSSSSSIISGVLLGLGFAICYTDPIYISLFVILSLSTIAFKCNLKVLSTLAYIVAYTLFNLFFGLGLSWGEMLSVIMGCFIYLIIPTRAMESLTDLWSGGRTVAVKDIFNNTKSELVFRVKELSEIFKEMDGVYRSMVKGNLPDDKAMLMLKEELVDCVCKDCVNKDRCFRSSNSFMDNCFDTIVELGYSKGKLLLVDLPEYLTTNCGKANSVIQSCNNLLSAYNDYKTSITNIDTSRILIADQLCGVSRLLEALSKEININVSFNNRLESVIKERLSYAGVYCCECVVYEQDIQSKTISIIVKNNNINVKNIEKIVSKSMLSKFKVDKIKEGVGVGTIEIILKSMPKYDIAFGSSVVTKSGKVVSGDNHIIVPVGDGKYIVSICDGMGSGDNANNISKLTLELIENFYRAGFDNEIILSSINKLLSLNEQENFSTIDLCAIDCKRGIYDFVKLGASDGYILRNTGEVEVISSSGLPIGVLENIKPHITKLCVNQMDIVVLVSDGIADILGESLRMYIRNSDVVNPQTLSENILQIALEKSNGIPQDDMTVVCVRVFENA